MELIQFNKNGGPVTIDITIVGVNIWSYVYASDLIFKNNSASGRAPNHTLGLPVNLDNDINSWDFRFGNISSSSIRVAATIIWKQDGLILNTWTGQTQVSAESATKISDDGLLIGSILTEAI